MLLPFPFLARVELSKVNAPENLRLLAAKFSKHPQFRSTRSPAFPLSPINPQSTRDVPVLFQASAMTASSWAAPPPGYPQGHGYGHGNQQLAAPQPQATAVPATAASSGLGNPYVVVTPAAAASSWAAPPPGYPQGHVHEQGNQQLASPQPQATAVPVTAASNGLGNPYVVVTPAAATPSTRQSIMKALGRYGKVLEDGTRKAADASGNIWHHLRTAPNMADAAVARLAQGTKVYAEGGHDRVFHQTFGTMPGEQLRKAYACYLSTSSGPVIGTLYLSTARLAFCSDSPLCYQGPAGQPLECMYYKAMLPLNQVRSVNPSASMRNRAERYIQITTTDNHEFWFMGFVNYDKALKNLYEALQHRDVHGHHSS
ncbi:GEM-like protein 1 isoform X2 [Phragmites australis]|uniref:GEM-like protein 1 isoform X2 n=1 Tax=Phragmites australis TaxID=29695 RepID=UPI002D797CFE|nr:GEM-like protein 1 isoform X2 [Phragmites australis]